jgi:hypothetical protein
MTHDPKLVSKIMAKREQEKSRNTMRRAGLDIAACDQMKSMKRAASEAALREDKEHGWQLQTQGRIGDAVAAILEDKARKTHRECVEYSLANLRKENRREWYLSDPNQLKNDVPSRRDGYEVPLCSFQKFEGETMGNPEIIKEKNQAQSAWLASQVAEKKARHENLRFLEKVDDEALLNANSLRHVVEAAKQEDYKEDLKEIVKENQELALAKKAREDAWRLQNQQANDAHCAYSNERNLARERHDFEVGADGKRRDCKRSTYEEEQDVWDYNAAQLVGKRAEKQAAAQIDVHHAQIDGHLDMVTKALDDEKARRIRARREEIELFNKAIAQEKRQRDATEKAGYGSFTLSR